MNESTVDIKWGKRFRQAWIDAVRNRCPGDVEDAWVLPWEEMPSWERGAAIRAYDQIRVLRNTHGIRLRTLPEWAQGFVLTTAWNDAVHAVVTNPEPGWTQPWTQLPHWRQQVNIDIFRALTANGPDAA